MSDNIQDCFHQIINNEPIIDNVSLSCRDLITSMLAKSPSERPSTRQVLSHPWITESAIGRNIRLFDGIIGPQERLELVGQSADALGVHSSDVLRMIDNGYPPLLYQLIETVSVVQSMAGYLGTLLTCYGSCSLHPRNGSVPCRRTQIAASH